MSRTGRRWLVAALLVAALAALSAYEARYSADMQSHIDMVNRDLEDARTNALFSRGLLSAIQSITDDTNVATEILETRDHVHTVRDELLAWKIKKAAGDSVTGGQAMYAVIGAWKSNV